MVHWWDLMPGWGSVAGSAEFLHSVEGLCVVVVEVGLEPKYTRG